MKDQYKTDGPQTADGVNWWHVEVTPGTKSQKFGGEKRIAAYLKFNVPLGATFTMRDLRTAIAPATGPAEDAEQ